jgi:hypothetical protein
MVYTLTSILYGNKNGVYLDQYPLSLISALTNIFPSSVNLIALFNRLEITSVILSLSAFTKISCVDR